MTIAKGRRASGFRNFTTFTAWLNGQVGRGDAVGEFARIAAADPTWPRRRTTLAAFNTYLHERGGIGCAASALQAAWDEYEQAAGASAFRGSQARR